MQQMLLADALKPETPPRERAQVACAWEKLEERKRILRMRPKPKDIAVDAVSLAKRARRSGGGMLPEPIDPTSPLTALPVEIGNESLAVE
jgi:hypothetical protein